MTDNSARLAEFIEENYRNDLFNSAKEESPAGLIIDFNLLDKFDDIIGNQLLEYPESVLEDFKKAIANVMPNNESRISVRIKNLPERRAIRIRYLRSKHLNKLWRIDAIIKSASEVKPQIYEAMFECPDCRAKITVPQESSLLQKPYYCGAPYIEQGCGRRGDFGEPVDKKMFDFRFLGGVEPFELTTGERPGEITIMLKEDLTTPRMQKKTDPGSNLKIVGILKEIPKRIKGRLSTKMDMYLEANYIESSEMDFEELEINEEDEKKIKELSQDPLIYEKLKASIAPGIYGFDEIKESIVLQLFGGIRHTLPDGSTIRGNIHILLTGDPGVGKSVLGSSKILHNSRDKPEYTTIADLVDSRLRNEKIVLENGAEISTTNNDGVKVLALNPKTFRAEWQPVSAFIRHESPEFLVKVRTKSGREITATEDHSFVVLNEKGELLNIQGSSVKSGMFVPVPLNAHKEMKSEISIKQEIRTNANKLPERMKLDRDFGFFMGMFLSEGSLTKGSIYIDSHNEQRRLMLKKFSDSIGLHSHMDSKRIIFSSRNLVRFLEECCYKGEKIGKGKGSGAFRKCIPDFCFYAPKDFIYGLLSGMFSGDGYFLNAKPTAGRTKGNLKVGYSTISENLAHGLLDMLSLMGIFAVVRKKNYVYKGEKRVSHEITVLGQHAGCLLENVNLTGKSREVDRFSEKDAFDAIPCTELIYSIVKKLGYSRRLAEGSAKRRAFAAMMRTARSRKKMGRRRAERICRQLLEEAKIQKNEEAMRSILKLKQIMDGNVAWDCIHDVERIKSSEKYVYDLSIDGYETFAANNIIVHNTQFLKLVSRVVPRSKYVSGSGVTGAGLTASVIKNELLGSWVLEAGALILCNKGLIAIDEFDKMNKDDQIAMHEATSVETVSIAKASIVATLPAQTAVLAGANPKFGRFDPYKPIVEQIQIPETLLSRFDLKFSLRDVPNRTTDEKLAEHIMASRTNPEAVTPVLNTNFLRKYIAYVKRVNTLVMNTEAAEAMKNFYVEMRNRYTGSDIKTISITLRQYEALIRLAEASAKIRLDTDVRMQDAERAIKLLKYSLMQLGYDTETGRIDIDRIESGITAGKRKRISTIIEIIEEMQKEAKEVAEQDLLAEAENRGIENTDEIKEILDRLKREGTIFEPRPGFIRKV